MGDDLLPKGMLGQYKAATRALVMACGGPAGVRAVIDISDGALSRWQSDAYPRDLIPLWAVARLEFHHQEPAFTRFMAGVTGHRLVPMAGDDDGSRQPEKLDFVADLVGVTGAASKVTAGISDALADGKVTPCEARAVNAHVSHLEHRLTSVKRRLTVVTDGA